MKANTLFMLASLGALSLTGFAQTDNTSTGTTSSGATTSETSSTSSTGWTVAGAKDGIVKQDGKVYFIKNGRVEKIDRELRLSEGITVQTDGDVLLKDGTKVSLKDGSMVTLEGQILSAPPEFKARGEAYEKSGTR